MSEIRKNDHRLMQVLLAPVISEKAMPRSRKLRLLSSCCSR